jgi:hypothetical protein
MTEPLTGKALLVVMCELLLVLALLWIQVVIVLILARVMLLHDAPRGAFSSFPAAPVHLSTELRAMCSAAPVQILAFQVVLVTVLTLPLFIVVVLFLHIELPCPGS